MTSLINVHRPCHYPCLQSSITAIITAGTSNVWLALQVTITVAEDWEQEHRVIMSYTVSSWVTPCHHELHCTTSYLSWCHILHDTPHQAQLLWLHLYTVGELAWHIISGLASCPQLRPRLHEQLDTSYPSLRHWHEAMCECHSPISCPLSWEKWGWSSHWNHPQSAGASSYEENMRYWISYIAKLCR